MTTFNFLKIKILSVTNKIKIDLEVDVNIGDTTEINMKKLIACIP